MKCIVCGCDTEGSISRTGTVWPMVCLDCMDHENKVVEAALVIHPSPDHSQDAWVGLDEVETALMFRPTGRFDN